MWNSCPKSPAAADEDNEDEEDPMYDEDADAAVFFKWTKKNDIKIPGFVCV